MSHNLWELLTNRHTAGTIVRLLDCYPTQTWRWMSDELHLKQINNQQINDQEEDEQAEVK